MHPFALNADVSPRKLKVLCLLTPYYLYINTIREHLESLHMFSRHEWTFANASPESNSPAGVIRDGSTVDFSGYDVVAIHYCSRVCYDDQFSARTLAALHLYSGCKCLFIQDEYDNTQRARDWIRNYGVNIVFTVVPEPYIKLVYPPEMLPGVNFVPVLTGYVPIALERPTNIAPLASRTKAIAYRGREMPFIYGDLGQEKLMIGIKVRERCEQRGIPVDIEWTEDKRIYGRDWNRFLHSARATLGTESGCNVFDLYGTLRMKVEAALKSNPNLRYEEVRDMYFEEENLGVRMNQISPKFFEFIAARTAIIAFEGDYSGAIEPDLHYLALKKNYSNLDEILDRIEDLPFIEAMTERAYDSVVASGRYSWRSFADIVDAALETRARVTVPEPSSPISNSTPPPHWYAGTVSLLQNERALRSREIAEQKLAIISDHESMIERRKSKITKLEEKIDKMIRKMSATTS